MVWSQGIYYTSTGIWPLVHMASFMAVTGPKTDLWLVKMVGLLAVAIGICLLFSARRKEFPPLLFVLAVSSALAFMLIDSYYGYSGVIDPVYLADAVVQMAFALAYLVAFIRRDLG
jgi:energy-converting hydrogenase Eha subunit E